MAFTLVSAALLAFASVVSVRAESHTVQFDNKCGYGTPQLIQGGNVLTTTSYTSTGELSSAIAYLQTGSCLFNGEGCTLLEMTMTNPVSVGGGSSADISLIAPHTFNVGATIEFYGGCEGVSTTCDSESCTTAFKEPDDTWVQISCQADNANLLITFCPDSSSAAVTTTTTAKPTTTTSKKTSTEAATTSTEVATASTETATSSKFSATFASITRSSTPTVSASSSSPSASMCKHKRSERRAISEHRKRHGRSFNH
ncbi:hypothetical protein DFH07DRAFT_853538 [Mycena maculata]|uniref:Glycopeptide n=1 Tax=Mycena maculata TaxID=230809 RepID=A0AAD7HR64_9AGAR|nr:hypothetical protein DFH07DRAFT_853538 [Mycena maculata]